MNASTQARGVGKAHWCMHVVRASAPFAQVIDGTCVKIYAWYDNEWGYSARFVDVCRMVAASL